MLNNHEKLIKEIKRRELLNHLVDAIISTHCKKKKKAQLKRGIIHTIVCKTLGLANSYYMRRIINERMEAMGFRKKIVHGYLYFDKCRLAQADGIEPSPLG